ncbi:hypothetical protein Ais01nite_24930 [Asanoa ishikariensis]|uniref:Lipoprotein LprG n=1 Tax=Asanoa ishikariensis TaxID=137265 RepID=A0A1H3R3M4_9ACTN|nr:hypothetical protein [Asanoa ishikariensis]GIF64458.1 hypothetical protein Ais01nite_24930 [Asanoa ishikariensis]SDZ20123.1 hypothetical protein SAMN05421684_3426 [Asanoa ishikariensis]
MRIRLATTGLGVFAALCIGLAGCGSTAAPGVTATPSAGSSDASPASAATAELTAAAQKLNDDTVKVTLESAAVTSTGNLDPKADKATMSVKVGNSSNIDLRSIGQDAWLQATGVPGVEPGKWLHIDGARLAGTTFDALPDGDAAGAGKFVERMADVTKSADGAYQGTIDLTKVAGSGVSVDVLGGKGNSVPFTAKVDDSGRLSELTIDLTTIDPQLGKMTTTYSDFGASVAVTEPPAADVVEAPESLLQALGAK